MHFSVWTPPLGQVEPITPTTALTNCFTSARCSSHTRHLWETSPMPPKIEALLYLCIELFPQICLGVAWRLSDSGEQSLGWVQQSPSSLPAWVPSHWNQPSIPLLQNQTQGAVAPASHGFLTAQGTESLFFLFEIADFFIICPHVFSAHTPPVQLTVQVFNSEILCSCHVPLTAVQLSFRISCLCANHCRVLPLGVMPPPQGTLGDV